MPFSRYRRLNMGPVVAGESSGPFSLPEPERWIDCPNCDARHLANDSCFDARTKAVYPQPIPRESPAIGVQFVAVGANVMQGSNRMATAGSSTFARRIANALNRYQHNPKKGY